MVDTAKWDRKVEKNYKEANFLQSSMWYLTNLQNGHEAKLIEIEGKDRPLLAHVIIKKAKRGRYLEVPGGPLIDWENDEECKTMISKLKEIAKKNKCAFIRLRPQLVNTPTNIEKLTKLGMKSAPMHLHAEHTLIMNLDRSEEDILASFRRQTRYEVRRAEKLGIKVEKKSPKVQGFDELLDEFFRTQQKTALRQHFIPPSKKELQNECESFGENAAIYVAKTPEGEPIAYGLILKFNGEADYFEAASTELNRKLPGAYALQWQVIRDLKKEGIMHYNLWGIAPSGQPHHRYAKVTTFKTGFAGEITNYVPAQDIVISKIKYIPDLIIETTRKKVRHLS